MSFRKGAILVGYGEPLTLFKEPKTCKYCGKQGLYWYKHFGKWNLHHYADLADGKGFRFVLHKCGFTSDGKKINETRT